MSTELEEKVLACCDAGERYVEWGEPEDEPGRPGWVLVVLDTSGGLGEALAIRFCPFCGRVVPTPETSS